MFRWLFGVHELGIATVLSYLRILANVFEEDGFWLFSQLLLRVEHILTDDKLLQSNIKCGYSAVGFGYVEDDAAVFRQFHKSNEVLRIFSLFLMISFCKVSNSYGYCKPFCYYACFSNNR